MRGMRTLARIAASAVAALGLVLLAPAAPASAHVTLKAASPASGATVQAPPAQVVLRFSGIVAADRTTIEVTGPGGSAVAVGRPSGSGSRVAVALSGPMANGTYAVAYQALSSDGHTVKGTYRFTLAAPAPPQPTATTPPPTTPAAATPAPPTSTFAPAAADTEDGGMGGGTVAAAVAVPVLLLAGAGFLLARRRTPRT